MNIAKYITAHNVATAREICRKLGISEASFSQKINGKNTSVKDHERIKIKQVIADVIEEKEKHINNIHLMLQSKEEMFNNIKSILNCDSAKDLLLFNDSVIEVTDEHIEVLKAGKTKLFQYYQINELMDFLK